MDAGAHVTSTDTDSAGPPPLVTLIVPVRNEERHIGACLASIAAQEYPADRLETIVVDGDSDDRTVEFVMTAMAAGLRARLLANQRRSMPYGLNIGIEAAWGEMIGVVSGHSVLPPRYVATMANALLSTDAWSVGARIERRTANPMHAAIARATESRIGVGDSGHNYATRAGWVETAFPGFWRREVFDRVGLFDPDMLVNEDNELSFRIRRAGGGIWYEPSISVEYVPRPTLIGLFKQYHDYARGKLRVLKKHHGGLRWRHLAPPAWVAYVVGGVAMAFVIPRARIVWLAGIGVYALVIAVASVRLGRRDKPWGLVAAALVALHAGYGTGWWRGVFELLARRSGDGSRR